MVSGTEQPIHFTNKVLVVQALQLLLRAHYAPLVCDPGELTEAEAETVEELTPPPMQKPIE